MLEYMDKAVNEKIDKLVEQHEEQPVLQSALACVGGADTPKTLWGIDVPVDMRDTDQARRNQARRWSEITRYKNDAIKLNKLLREAKVKPLAIITKKAFNELVEELQLLQLRPSTNGYIQLEPAPVLALAKVPGLRGAVHTAVLALVGCCVGLFAVPYIVSPSNTVAALAVGLSFAGFVAAQLLCAAGLNWWCDRITTRRVERWVNSLSWGQLLRELSFEKSGRFFAPNWEDDDHPFTRKLLLPPAPSTVVEALSRLMPVLNSKECSHCYQLNIAAEADAVQFVGGLQFKGASIRKEIARLRRDPILYVTGNDCTAVAIVAQYGELPIEKQLIDRIVNSEHLL